MIKLPKCPHCDKLLVAVIGDAFTVGGGPAEHHQAVAYLCPEKMNHVEPEWVEVLEVS